MKITLITSQPNWDATFINRAAKKNKKYETSLIVRRENGYFTDGNRVKISDYLDCDLLILNNNNSSFEFSNSVYSNIISYLERGGNLLYLNKIDTELKKILPLQKSKYNKEVETGIILTKLAQNYQSYKTKQTWYDTNDFWQSLPPISTQFYSAKIMQKF